MSEPSPDRPKTVDVDAEISKRIAKDGIVVLGFFCTVAGLTLRIFAHTLAWPKQGLTLGLSTLSGSVGEKLYIDLGMVSLVFGLAILFLVMARVPRPRDTA